MPLLFKQQTDEAAVQACIEKDVPPVFDYLESQLSENATALVGGKFSIGDIGVATHFVNLRHARLTVDASRWPKLAKYIANVHARPSFKAVIDEEEAMFKPK
jgi:glutathione S-transferase